MNAGANVEAMMNSSSPIHTKPWISSSNNIMEFLLRAYLRLIANVWIRPIWMKPYSITVRTPNIHYACSVIRVKGSSLRGYDVRIARHDPDSQQLLLCKIWGYHSLKK